MCGIAGIFDTTSRGDISIEIIRDMVSMLHHRGPDDSGFYQDESVGLGHARLSIIDLSGGRQPIHNEDKTIWITFNGEIFNYLELRDVLIAKGHEFSTHTDTEVIVHLYEEYGVDCLSLLNGQFAFAIWDKIRHTVFLARDRVGIRPLFYTYVHGSLIFASEIKALFMDRRVKREIDPFAIDQIFTCWSAVPPRSAFRDISELPAGCYLLAKREGINVRKYWEPDFSSDESLKSEREYAEILTHLLIDATKLQLRADVPVGAYLSGGIDSSVITTLIARYTNSPLRTFSVGFTDQAYDESRYQREMIDYLRTDHSSITCSYADIGSVFPQVVWHAEKPMVRTAPAPLFLLSKLVRDSGYKVVLTGEGSDEILAGYDLFKETKVRKFIERYPESKYRPLILKRLYPYLANSPVKSLAYAEAFFRNSQSTYPDKFYSHIPRWTVTERIKYFFSEQMKQEIANNSFIDDISAFLPDNRMLYDDLSIAQYIEMKTLLPGYILSSQGDRVAMAHSVEGRFPFLDHRVIEFCCKLPPHFRMQVLEEKYILKESMKDLIPNSVLQRKKQPYMAPDSQSFFNGIVPDYIEDILSEGSLKTAGYFDPAKVLMLVKKVRQNPVVGFKDNMAIVGIISTLLLRKLFIEEFVSYSRNHVEQRVRSASYAGKI
jgi:asparagine synthase (glutamine-hydrolysing)